MSNKRALILLSGGMDSAVCLAYAKALGYRCYALIFDYGQRHSVEIEAAIALAQAAQVPYMRLQLPLVQIGGSSLVDTQMEVDDYEELGDDIPNTYVPARNIIFLSYALGVCEAKKMGNLFIGVNAVDYSNYPDCRPEFINAFQEMALKGMPKDENGCGIVIHTPLIHLTKAEIIKLGHKHQVDFSKTITCYRADDQGRACGTCASCVLRQQGYEDAGIKDDTRYQEPVTAELQEA